MFVAFFFLFSILWSPVSTYTCYNQKSVSTSDGAPVSTGNVVCCTLPAICAGAPYGADLLGLSSTSLCGTTIYMSAPNGANCTATYQCCYSDLCNTYNKSNAGSHFAEAGSRLWFIILLVFLLY